jgi:tRNA threonylcarbamoyladenosine dehydratase
MNLYTPAQVKSHTFTDNNKFYTEFTSRNAHFIEPETQRRISELDVLIAGCGSTGGACIEPLARLGVRRFRLADNGSYEITNLNRQHARLDSVGKNKAAFHADEIRSIQPYSEIISFEEGITESNLNQAISGAHLVMDAIDVTTRSGLEMKIRLHEECAARRVPVFSALDLGYRQWGRSFDYRKAEQIPLDGLADAARKKNHPISALFTLYPLSSVPDHALVLIDDLLENRVEYASQLGATSDLLSSIIVAATIRYVESGDLLPGWSFDLWPLKEGRKKSLFARAAEKINFWKLRRRIQNRINRDGI